MTYDSLSVRGPDLRVDGALSLPPGLAASVLFLCVRQADCSGDQALARSLSSAAVTAMKAALKVTASSPWRHMAEVQCVRPELRQLTFCLFCPTTWPPRTK